HLLHARHAKDIHLIALFGNGMAHRFQDGLGALFNDFRGDASLLAGFAENGSVGAAVKQNTSQRDFEARYSLNAGGEGVEVDTVTAAEQGAIYVEQIGILRIPGKTWLDGNARFLALWSCRHDCSSCADGRGDCSNGSPGG